MYSQAIEFDVSVTDMMKLFLSRV